MQLRLFIDLENQPLELPIAHHHILASAYYSLMGPKESMIHDDGMKFGKREYRLFTFGPISGRYTVNKVRKRISFFGQIEMEFRAWNPNVVMAVAENALLQGVTFGRNTYRNVRCELANQSITKNVVEIEMISPICARKTHTVCMRKTFQKKHKTVHFKPQMKQFAEAVRENFARKYAAVGEETQSQVQLEPISVGIKDKYLTRYKENTIEAYKGVYRLHGTPDQLTFLYNVGLGEKNSQGFGMFRWKGVKSDH